MRSFKRGLLAGIAARGWVDDDRVRHGRVGAGQALPIEAPPRRDPWPSGCAATRLPGMRREDVDALVGSRRSKRLIG